MFCPDIQLIYICVCIYISFFDKDVMHTYFGIAGLSLMNESGFLELDPAINISKKAKEHLLNNSIFYRQNWKFIIYYYIIFFLQITIYIYY